MNVLLDSDVATRNIINIVQAIDISLWKIDDTNNNILKKVLYSLNTNDYRGSIREGLVKEIKNIL